MRRFCLECGHEAKEQEVICTNCGTKLPEIEKTSIPQQEPKRTQPKKPLTKAQKLIYIISGALIVILIACYAFASNYFSEKSLTQRFNEALSDKNPDKLATIIVHEDGSSISKEEAQAFLALEKAEGERYIKNFLEVKQADKFLGMISRNKVFADDQYAYFEGSAKGMKFKFNKKEVTGDKLKDKVVFGPFAPGIYTVGIELDNDFGKNSTEIKDVSLDTHEDVEIVAEVSEAKISIENYNSDLMSDAYILINGDKKIAVKDGESEEFGPLFLNGTATATVVVNYPWGEVKSEAYKLNDSNAYLSAAVLSDNEIETIGSTLLNFGEQYANGRASKSTSVFTQVTDNLKDALAETMDSYIEYDYYYTGQLDSINIDEDSIYFDDDKKVYIDAQYQYTEDYSYTIDETPDPESTPYDWEIGLLYDEKSKSWLVDSVDSSWSSVEGTKTFEGSKKLYTPDEKVVKSQKDKEITEDLQGFMTDYNSAAVDALNSRDIDYVESYFAPDAPAKEESEKYYEHVEKNNITETFLGTEVTDVKDKGDETYEVTSIDKYTIDIDGKESDKSYTTVTTVKKIDDSWKVYKLNSTNENN